MFQYRQDNAPPGQVLAHVTIAEDESTLEWFVDVDTLRVFCRGMDCTRFLCPDFKRELMERV